VNQNGVRGPAAKVQREISHEWTNLREGVLLPLTFVEGPTDSSRLEDHHGEE
jgi:hypothetical protein